MIDGRLFVFLVIIIVTVIFLLRTTAVTRLLCLRPLKIPQKHHTIIALLARSNPYKTDTTCGDDAGAWTSWLMRCTCNVRLGEKLLGHSRCLL